jgi:hypothetical protein
MPVDYPAQPKPDWVKSGTPVTYPDEILPPGRFPEEPGGISVIRIAASPDDFYGSKLYDGLDVTVQPLDASNKPLKKLGHLTATLYRFEGDTLEGKGEKLFEWHVSASRMAKLWVESGLDRGYHMKLAWDRRAMVKDVKLEVRFDDHGESFTKVISAGSVDQPRYRWLEK